jgi:Arc/MetJ family transcription regulator
MDILSGMTKRLVDIDDDLLERAQEVLGSRTIKETVNRALDETVRLELRRRLIDRLSRMEGLDLDDPEVMKGAWRTGGRTS